MALEHQNDEQRLLTTEEAQTLIELYAEREQARRAEAERLAAMPKLSDVAGLIGVAPQELVPLLNRLRGTPQVTGAGEPDLDVRMSQFEADRVIELYGQTERERQAELERRAQLTSLHEVAEGLQIPVEDAEELLNEVRRRRQTFGATTDPGSRPFQEELLSDVRRRRDPSQQQVSENLPKPIMTGWLQNDYEEQDADYRAQQRAKTAGQIVAFFAAVVVLIIVLNMLASVRTVNSAGSYPNYAQSGPTWRDTVRTAPSPTATVIRISPFGPGTPSPSVTMVGFPAIPAGWTLKLYDGGGIAEVQSSNRPVLSVQEAQSQIRQSAAMFLANQQGLSQGLSSAASAVPYLPATTPMRCSDIAGWAILEIGDGKTVRRVYIPTGRQNDPKAAEAQQAELGRRLDYVVGLPAGALALKGTPKFAEVQTAECVPPAGTTVTVFAFGQAYRSVGKPLSGEGVNVQMCSVAIEESVRNLVRYAYLKNKAAEIVTTPGKEEFVISKDASGRSILVPFKTEVNVSFTYGVGSFPVYGYREALMSGNLKKLAESLNQAKPLAAMAASGLSRGQRVTR
jgi:hypothetical protein